MYSIKIRCVVFIVINILINEVIGFHLNEDDIKKVIQHMQQKLLHGQSKAQDSRSRNDNHDLIDNDKRNVDYRGISNLDDTDDVIRTNTEAYKDNPLTILIYRNKDNTKELQEDVIVKNILKEIILHDKSRHKKHQLKSKQSKVSNVKSNDFSNEVKDLKHFSKLYLILNTSPGNNLLKSEDLDDLGKLLSKLLVTKANKKIEKENLYYKGFLIKDDQPPRRRRRDSDESEDDDYRPKRSRIRKVVSVGGRTFAPSIGKKRNIYESE